MARRAAESAQILSQRDNAVAKSVSMWPEDLANYISSSSNLSKASLIAVNVFLGRAMRASFDKRDSVVVGVAPSQTYLQTSVLLQRIVFQILSLCLAKAQVFDLINVVMTSQFDTFSDQRKATTVGVIRARDARILVTAPALTPD